MSHFLGYGVIDLTNRHLLTCTGIFEEHPDNVKIYKDFMQADNKSRQLSKKYSLKLQVTEIYRYGVGFIFRYPNFEPGFSIHRIPGFVVSFRETSNR
jgi:hypothetical protein